MSYSNLRKLSFLVKNINTYGTISFNNLPLVKENMQKNFGLFLGIKLNFLAHINEKIKKANRGISENKILNLSLPRSSLITIYKSFNLRDIIYGQPSNASLKQHY